jgi:hypothetical protein
VAGVGAGCISTFIGSGATGGGGMDREPEDAAGDEFGEDLVAALMTDLRLKMLPKPLVLPLELGVLERRVCS